jgi:hypothetical protein
MKTFMLFCTYISQYFPEREVLQTNVTDKNETFYVKYIFFVKFKIIEQKGCYGFV